jgi:hypothetical protein
MKRYIGVKAWTAAAVNASHERAGKSSETNAQVR